MKKNKYKQKRLEKKLLDLTNLLFIKGVSIDLNNKKKEVIKNQYLKLLNSCIELCQEIKLFIESESDIVSNNNKKDKFKKMNDDYLNQFIISKDVFKRN